MQAGTEKLLADHYQKTFELTLKVWEQRNRTFLILLVTVGAASLLTFNVAQAQPLLADLISKLAGIEDAARRAELRNSFPYGLIQSILLMAVLYLTLILYHRTTFILQSYAYLPEVENELRAATGIGAEMVSFSREGSFYRTHRPAFGKLIGGTYVVMLGLLLSAFCIARIYGDIKSSQFLFAAVDSLISLAILPFYFGYARSSLTGKIVNTLNRATPDAETIPILSELYARRFP